MPNPSENDRIAAIDKELKEIRSKSPQPTGTALTQQAKHVTDLENERTKLVNSDED